MKRISVYLFIGFIFRGNQQSFVQKVLPVSLGHAITCKGLYRFHHLTKEQIKNITPKIGKI